MPHSVNEETNLFAANREPKILIMKEIDVEIPRNTTHTDLK
jgi:hypothetical protein